MGCVRLRIEAYGPSVVVELPDLARIGVECLTEEKSVRSGYDRDPVPYSRRCQGKCIVLTPQAFGPIDPRQKLARNCTVNKRVYAASLSPPAPRNVGIPLAALSPAPAKAKGRLALRSAARNAWADAEEAFTCDPPIGCLGSLSLAV